MHVPPDITAVKAALCAAGQNAVDASYVHGAAEVVEALQTSRDNVQAAIGALHALCPADPTSCAVLQSIEGLTTRLDSALLVARQLDPVDGQLPVGTVDPVFVELEHAAELLFASRWG